MSSMKRMMPLFFFFLAWGFPAFAQSSEIVRIEDRLVNTVKPEWQVKGYVAREDHLIDPEKYVGRIQYFYSYRIEGPFLNCTEETSEAAFYGDQYYMRDILNWPNLFELRNHKEELGLDENQVFQVWQMVCRDSIGSFYPFFFSYSIKLDKYGYRRITDQIGYAMVGGTIFILKPPNPVEWDMP